MLAGSQISLAKFKITTYVQFHFDKNSKKFQITDINFASAAPQAGAAGVQALALAPSKKGRCKMLVGKFYKAGGSLVAAIPMAIRKELQLWPQTVFSVEITPDRAIKLTPILEQHTPKIKETENA